MHPTVGGTYRNGHIELAETPSNIGDDTPVLVTFLTPGEVDLRSRGIDEAQAAELRARLSTFSEDWESPEMADYDDYEANRRKLDSR
jgi:hypothetical protein